MDLSYPAVRDRLTQWGLWPRSRVARGAWYALGLALFLFLLQQLFAVLRLSWGQGLGGWVSFLSFIAILFFSILAFRWLKNKILWRLRNRLIVTYVFIGVIPTLLLFAMAFATLYLFAGQFANFIVTSEIHLQLQNVEAVNAAIANELSVRLQHGEPPTVALLESLRKTDVIWKHRDVCAWYGAKPLPICGDGKGNTPFTQPSFVYAPFSEIVRDHGNLYLRTANLLTVRSDRLLVVSSEALDQELVQEIANNLGEITLYGTGLALQEPSRTEGTVPEIPEKRRSLQQNRRVDRQGKGLRPLVRRLRQVRFRKEPASSITSSHLALPCPSRIGRQVIANVVRPSSRCRLGLPSYTTASLRHWAISPRALS